MSTVVVIEGRVGGVMQASGNTSPVSGIDNGSTVVTCNDFATNRVFVMRGNFGIPAFVNSLSDYYLKFISDSFLTFSTPLVAGEYIYIETIPE